MDLASEVAVVGYRAHSMIHGTFEPVVPAGTYSAGQLSAFEVDGIAVEDTGDGSIKLEIPPTVAFGNPDLVRSVGLGPVLQSLGGEREYRNDEQIDNSLRSVLFQVPKPGVPDPTVCGQPVIQPDCFTVLLPRRPRSAADPAALRDRLPAQPRRPDRARYRRDGAAERLRSDGLMN